MQKAHTQTGKAWKMGRQIMPGAAAGSFGLYHFCAASRTTSAPSASTKPNPLQKRVVYLYVHVFFFGCSFWQFKARFQSQ